MPEIAECGFGELGFSDEILHLIVLVDGFCEELVLREQVYVLVLLVDRVGDINDLVLQDADLIYLVDNGIEPALDFWVDRLFPDLELVGVLQDKLVLPVHDFLLQSLQAGDKKLLVSLLLPDLDQYIIDLVLIDRLVAVQLPVLLDDAGQILR